MFENLEKKLQQWSFSRTAQQAFLEDICALIKDGVPAPQAIATVRDISKGGAKDLANAILKQIAEGQRIADGLKGWFPPSIIEIIRAGEEGGSLVETLNTAARSVGEQSSAITSLIASIAYPITVFVMGLAVAVFLKHSIFVNFEQIKPVSGWPFEGRALLGLATFVEEWWWLTIIFMGFIAYGIKRMLTDSTGEIRKYVDNIPLLSLYRSYSAARFMETLGLLLTNGISFKRALSIMQRNSSKYVSWHIYMMQFRLSGGRENIADVLDTGMVREEDILRLRVMARGRGFETALLHLGAQALERNTRAITVSGKIAGGLLLALDAGLAIFMIFAIYNVGSYVGT